MKNKEIEESINRIQRIVDFYKLNDENNYDYSDDVLISMKNLLSYIEQLENNRDKAIEFMKNNSKISLDDSVSIIRFYKQLKSILESDSDYE